MDGGGHEDVSLPPYAYVPKGPWPHPTSSPQGHSFGRAHPAELPIVSDAWDRSAAYRRGVTLFNAGYYWEAHEAWEGLWHAHGRHGTTADILRGLIKLAAAGVKVRERQPGGVVTHARSAAGLFRSAHALTGRNQLGLDLDDLAVTAQQIADDPPTDPGLPGDRVVRVFAFQIDPRPDFPAR